MKKYIFLLWLLSLISLSSCGLVPEIPDNEINARWRWIDGKWAIEDKEGKTIISTIQFQDHCYEYTEWRCFVKKNGKYWYLDTHWELVIPYAFDEASNFSDGLASVSNYGKRYFINRNGGTAFTFEGKDYVWDHYFFNWVLPVRNKTNSRNNNFGVINKKGELIIPIEHTSRWTQYYSWNTYIDNNFRQGKILIMTWSTSPWKIQTGFLYPDGTIEWNK